MTTAILTPAGLQNTDYHATTLGDAQTHEPSGIYTVARTFQRGKALLFDAHLDRLEESARLENIPLQLDRPALRAALRTLISQTDYDDVRFRITVPKNQPDHLYLAVEQLVGVPQHLRENGVRVASSTLQRHNPTAKTTDWMQAREIPDDFYEAVLVNAAGEILEGSSSNFYAIMNGVLRTADASLVLNGISRRTLLAAVEGFVPVEFRPVTIQDSIQEAVDEALLTSSSRGVVPIVEIDGRAIGDGQPGALTREIAARYDAWTDAHLEPI